MSIESHRSTIQKQIISEGIAGRKIDDDADFLSLVERWVHREIAMMEMRKLYDGVREKRPRRKWGADSRPAVDLSVSQPPPSTDELLAETARITRASEEG